MQTELESVKNISLVKLCNATKHILNTTHLQTEK